MSLSQAQAAVSFRLFDTLRTSVARRKTALGFNSTFSNENLLCFNDALYLQKARGGRVGLSQAQAAVSLRLFDTVLTSVA